MKNTTKTIAAVLAVFLAAALFVGAASAADDYRNVTVPGTAFVYEKIFVDDPNAATLAMVDTNGNPVNILTGSAEGNGYTYNLVASTIGSNYGRYYLGGKTGNDYIDIWAPELVLKAELKDNPGTSVDGKTVTKNTDITFSLQAPHVGPASGQATQNISVAFDNIDAVLTSVAASETVDATNYTYIYTNVTNINGNLTNIFSIALSTELKTDFAMFPKTLTGATPAGIAANVTQLEEDMGKFMVENPTKVNYDDELYPVAHITFTTPAGGKTTLFGDTSYAAIFLEKNVETEAGTSNAGTNAQAGPYTAQAEYIAPALFDQYAKESNTVTFTVQSATLSISAAKDKVIRTNPITVTIQGEAKTSYYVSIRSCVAGQADAPALLPEQSGYKATVPLGTPQQTGTAYQFETDASGQRTIEFTTNEATDDKTYTIEVYAGYDDIKDELTGDHDSVKVSVEKGAVTISASGDGSYYIGDEIVLSGTNTDSDYVFLFITGQNVDPYVLQELPRQVLAKNSETVVDVKTDDTWEYKWDTAGIALDPGTYTIYATSALTNGKSSTKDEYSISKYSVGYNGQYGTAVKLSDSEYATVSVRLMKPFLSAVPSGTVVAKGDKLVITGTAEGDPNSLKLYIFGTNYFHPESISVEDDGSYEKEIPIPSGLASGQYFVVIQHPMMNGAFDADLKGSEGNRYFEILNVGQGGTAQSSFYVEGNDKLTGSQAADSLTKMIDSANIDDIYTKLTFTVSDPWIAIEGPGDQAMGTTFTISGTTNLAVDDQISVEVTSSSFTAAEKTQNTGTSGVTVITKVVAGDGVNNVWSVEVDSTNWELDEYIVNVDGLEIDVTATATFNLVEKVVTPTATATGATPTTTATATATATATPATPGFGAFVALAGLGAVALLVLRRN